VSECQEVRSDDPRHSPSERGRHIDVLRLETRLLSRGPCGDGPVVGGAQVHGAARQLKVLVLELHDVVGAALDGGGHQQQRGEGEQHVSE
jgi:hypothetical protein